ERLAQGDTAACEYERGEERSERERRNFGDDRDGEIAHPAVRGDLSEKERGLAAALMRELRANALDIRSQPARVGSPEDDRTGDDEDDDHSRGGAGELPPALALRDGPADERREQKRRHEQAAELRQESEAGGQTGQ